MAPKVSVVMSVYNGERFLREAVESILNQTFTDFEFIIIDDGSTDSTWSIVTAYRDARMRLVRNEENTGLTRSLNKGLTVARGEYVARMDADDVSLPERLETQIAFLDHQPEVAILGTACYMIGADGHDKGIRRMPVNDLAIRWTSLLNNPFVHPTVMLRRRVLDQHQLAYTETFRTAQDYDLWVRLLDHAQGANLPGPLLRYRLGTGVTSNHREDQLRNHDQIALRAITDHLPGVTITHEQVSQLRAGFVGGREFGRETHKPTVALAELYAELLGSFVHAHRGVVGLNALQRREAHKVAIYIARLPLELGWIQPALRLVRQNPDLSWSFWGVFLKRSAYCGARRWGNRLVARQSIV